ncbi:hypothetical protein BDU57DRAFT_515732 [Ampelomyces quisqualis]|uniref:Uncharacterized protein n=1 Tax=Ampelomyces quisqualis TaxID=50730 RepID=A0A6A5QKI2_AMPQU|nr:hypothetical protein BDU57DRAFT_515732 [Ampelomyces quisqualis]
MSYKSATEPKLMTFTKMPMEIKEMIYENAIYGDKYFNKNSLGLLDACSTNKHEYSIVCQLIVRNAPLSLLVTRPADATDLLHALISVADNDEGSGFAMVKSVAIAYGENYDVSALKQNMAIMKHCPNLRAITVKIPMSELLIDIPPPPFDWIGDFLTADEYRDVKESYDQVQQRPLTEQELRDKFALRSLADCRTLERITIMLTEFDPRYVELRSEIFWMAMELKMLYAVLYRKQIVAEVYDQNSGGNITLPAMRPYPYM